MIALHKWRFDTHACIAGHDFIFHDPRAKSQASPSRCESGGHTSSLCKRGPLPFQGRPSTALFPLIPIAAIPQSTSGPKPSAWVYKRIVSVPSEFQVIRTLIVSLMLQRSRRRIQG